MQAPIWKELAMSLSVFIGLIPLGRISSEFALAQKLLLFLVQIFGVSVTQAKFSTFTHFSKSKLRIQSVEVSFLYICTLHCLVFHYHGLISCRKAAFSRWHSSKVLLFEWKIIQVPKHQLLYQPNWWHGLVAEQLAWYKLRFYKLSYKHMVWFK